MHNFLDLERAAGFPDFDGANLTARLPLRESVVNDLLRAAVFKRGPKGPLTGLTFTFHGGNRFTLTAAVDQWPLPKSIDINGAFAPTTDFVKDPRLLILLAPSGLIGMLLKIVLGAIESIRPFLTVSGEQVFIDLPVILAKAGAADYVPLLRTLRISSEPGTLTLELNLQVNAKQTL